jgi:hypothetical protein
MPRPAPFITFHGAAGCLAHCPKIRSFQLLDRFLRHAKRLQLFNVFEQGIIRMEDFKLVVLPALENFFTLQFRHVFKFKA